MQEVATTYHRYQRIALVVAPLVALIMLIAPPPSGMTLPAWRTAAISVLIAAWWITEALPLAATSLLPIAIFPLLGILSAKEVATAYSDPNILLYMGGFFIAMSIQKWNLHERIALTIVYKIGADLRRLVLGFMIATALLSMWISNTATTVMMLPIGLAVGGHVKTILPGKSGEGFAACLLLATAYAASIGGVATLIGTPPNIVLASVYEKTVPNAQPIGFLDWIFVGLPFSIIFLPIVWFLLTRVLYKVPAVGARESAEDVARRLKALGPMTRGEKTVLTVTCMCALSWIFRRDIELGFITIPGWSQFFPGGQENIHDSTVAIFYAALLFIIPIDLKRGDFALDWEWAKKTPWGVLLLFGGGLALAKAFAATDLVLWLGGGFNRLNGVPTLLMIACVALLLTFLTELTSNVATTTIMLPILAAAAPSLGVHPLLLMIPAAISASCAFMLPVATPPNAIVFGSGYIQIAEMVRAGIIINLVGALLVTLVTYFIAVPVFNLAVQP